MRIGSQGQKNNPKRKRGSWACSPASPFLVSRGDYQLIFIPNWISRESVEVEVILTGVRPVVDPSALNIISLETGTRKLGWLRMLNISTRNCVLMRSVRRRFLKTEKSRSKRLGPTI